MAVSLPRLRRKAIAVKRGSAALTSRRRRSVPSVEPSSTKRTLQARSSPSSTVLMCSTSTPTIASSLKTGMTTAISCRTIFPCVPRGLLLRGYSTRLRRYEEIVVRDGRSAEGAQQRQGEARLLGDLGVGKRLPDDVGGYRRSKGDDRALALQEGRFVPVGQRNILEGCLLYTSDAADDLLCVDL